MSRMILLLIALVLAGGVAGMQPVTPTIEAAPAATDPFARTWARTDQPVLAGAVSRTWMWGPEAFTAGRWEDYVESPGGARQVQYFDKSRMEITNPDAVDDGLWYVTNGLLVVEMMGGEMQTGNEARVQRAPAQINIAGDPDDPLTYAVLAQRRGDAPLSVGAAVTQRIDASGQVTDDPGLAGRTVMAATHVVETNHTVASVFWEFMHASGLVHQDGATVEAPLFQSPFYATGLPITEAYWAEVKIGGTPHEVLLQCFERRCLTYAPENPPGWQVEAGNVGQHYYRWRYPEAAPGPSAQANELAKAVTQATNDEDRYQALLAVMNALHVGVYTPNGTMVLGGAERGAADFYLYDFELRMMSAALERTQTWGVVDLAMQLTALGMLPEGETLDPELVRQAILRGIAAAQRTPAEFSSLSPLLLRQLGLTQPAPYDLFEDVPLEAIRFNALAFFLVLSETTVPLVQDELPIEGATSNLIAQSNGILKPASITLQGICDPPAVFNGDAFKDAWGWAKIYAELVQLVPQAIARVTVVLDAMHGAILAFSVGVTELDQRLETHYGPAGHESDAGQPITFRIKVEMRDDLPDALVDCGWIAGTTFPPKGPIAGVSVHWFWGNLEDHGQINCGSACPTGGGSGLSIEATNGDGIAQMTFFPKNEENPDEGWVVEEHGIVTGVALYQSRFTNLLGSYAQYLTPKSGATRWVVKWHEPPGYRITIRAEYDMYTKSEGNNGLAASHHTASFVVEGWIPVEMVLPSYPYTPGLRLSVTGSGTAFHERVVLDADYHTTCNGGWSGSWSEGALILDVDDARSRNEPLRYIRMALNQGPPSALQFDDTCMAGFPKGSNEGYPYPLIDLQATGPQMATVDLCADRPSSGGWTCIGTLTTTTEVTFAGPPQ